MKISFVTTNKHKFEEVREILAQYDLEVEHLNIDYPENHDDSLEIVAKNAAQNLAKELGKSIILDDSGIFFDAYPKFPGALPKFVINTLGFKGIFKLLEGEVREATFKCIAAYCEPEKEPILFEGTMKGSISNRIHNPDLDLMPYEKIFIPVGNELTLSDLSREEKNKISHRYHAFKKLGEYLQKKN